MSSDEDRAGLMAAFKKGGNSTAHKRKETSFSPGLFFSEESSGSEKASTRARSKKPAHRVAVAVRVSPRRDLDEYIYYEPKPEVTGIVREYHRKHQTMYEVRMSTGETEHVSQCAALFSPG
jgi:hypothetical protein